jgi:N-acetylmuramoyl-L-alanine amidase
VVIFSDPGGRAYVNGRAVGPEGGFKMAGDILYVPNEAVASIRSALKSWVDVRPPPGVTPAPTANVLKVSGRVVIDAGHGGHDSGTTAAGKSSPEKNINLAVATAVVEHLRKRGLDVVVTREGDQFVDLDERVAIANRGGAKLFVSIHADSSEKPSDIGHTIITPDVNSPEATAAAREISRCLAAAGSPVHSVRKDVRHLRVLSATRVPAVIVELGFLSNPREAARLCDRACQQRMAQAIAEGVIAYLGRKQ